MGPSTPRETFGQLLRAIRQNAHLSVDRVAAVVGTTGMNLRLIEADILPPLDDRQIEWACNLARVDAPRLLEAAERSRASRRPPQGPKRAPPPLRLQTGDCGHYRGRGGCGAGLDIAERSRPMPEDPRTRTMRHIAQSHQRGTALPCLASSRRHCPPCPGLELIP